MGAPEEKVEDQLARREMRFPVHFENAKDDERAGYRINHTGTPSRIDQRSTNVQTTK